MDQSEETVHICLKYPSYFKMMSVTWSSIYSDDNNSFFQLVLQGAVEKGGEWGSELDKWLNVNLNSLLGIKENKVKLC